MMPALAIRAVVVASLLVNMGVAGSCPCSADGRVAATMSLPSRGDDGCVCKQKKGHCCCGDDCRCVQPARQQDDSTAIPSGIYQRNQPWAQIASFVPMLGSLFDTYGSNYHTNCTAGGNPSLVALGTRLNC